MAIFAGKYDHLSTSELARMISETSFVCMMLSYQLSQLVSMSVQVSQLLGVTFRISEMINEMQARQSDENDQEPQFYEKPEDSTLKVIRSYFRLLALKSALLFFEVKISVETS